MFTLSAPFPVNITQILNGSSAVALFGLFFSVKVRESREDERSDLADDV